MTAPDDVTRAKRHQGGSGPATPADETPGRLSSNTGEHAKLNRASDPTGPSIPTIDSEATASPIFLLQVRRLVWTGDLPAGVFLRVVGRGARVPLA